MKSKEINLKLRLHLLILIIYINTKNEVSMNWSLNDVLDSKLPVLISSHSSLIKNSECIWGSKPGLDSGIPVFISNKSKHEYKHLILKLNILVLFSTSLYSTWIFKGTKHQETIIKLFLFIILIIQVIIQDLE